MPSMSSEWSGEGPPVPRCKTRTREYRDGQLIDEEFGTRDVAERLMSAQDSTIWIDLQSPSREDLRIVTVVLGCHPMSADDAAEKCGRSIVRRVDDHVFLNMYVLTSEGRCDDLIAREMSIFITRRALITVRKEDIDIDSLIERWNATVKVASLGAGTAALAYVLLDAIVDGHLAAIDSFEDDMENLERHVFDRHGAAITRRQAYELDVQLARIRRFMASTREIIASLARNDADLVRDQLTPYYRDVFERAQHNLDLIDANRGRIDRVVSTKLNEQGAELNEITRRLAAWAAIITGPTLVTGFFGQNVQFPGVDTTAGFFISLLVIVTLAVVLYWLFRRNRWL